MHAPLDHRELIARGHVCVSRAWRTVAPSFPGERLPDRELCRVRSDPEIRQSKRATIAGNFRLRLPCDARLHAGVPRVAGHTTRAWRTGEVINQAQPPFADLIADARTRGACVYAFDLMEWGGRDIEEQPLAQRRAQHEALLKRGASRLIRFSESFPDANALLAECARRGLEGIVSKRKDAPYRSGTRSGWIKVKTQEWKDANRYRAKLSEKQRR